MSILPVNYIEVEQQSPEWRAMRNGCMTGSMVRYGTAKLASDPSLSKKCKDGKHETCEARHCNCACHGPRGFYQQCREDYMIDVVCTRLTGRMPERYVSKAMEDGIEREVLAISEYEKRYRVMTQPIGIVFHPTIDWFASSPDFLEGSNIVGEAKCPTEAVHLRYIREYIEAKAKGLEYVPEEYLPQAKSHLSCCHDRDICRFISFNPYFSDDLKLLVSDWRRDKGAIATQESEVIKFLQEAAELEKSLKSLKL